MRYISSLIKKDLAKKMVFVGGPRQVGKTTLAESIMNDYRRDNKSGLCLNWDFDEDRRAILGMKWTPEDKLIIFDELHKYNRWKNWLKGLYDKKKGIHQIIVTGSARLDVYKRGGDSLMGRYHYWRLHPFTLSEIPNKINPVEALKRLMTVGGFPEPFLAADENEARRWRRERYDKILKNDVRDLEPIRDIQTLTLFVDSLRQRVGTPVVLANIVEDLKVSHKTLSKWLVSLEHMHLLFIIKPYTQNIARAVLKPPRVYFFDNADVIGDEGAVFENLVACHLLKRAHYLEDGQGHRFDLSYIRDKEKREVDFVVVKNGHPEELIEVKLSEEKPTRSLIYYAERLKPKKVVQIVKNLNRPYVMHNILITDAYSYFKDDFKF
ncbi:MAG: ATP-binding protein [Deltaproteobacteria bacterium]|nr:ATP-binding protein [Deltaproteobacteria bacterium]